MRVTIRPSRIRGEAAAPPSKSMAHRLLICAALAEGTSVVRGVALSQDILATLDCLRALGAEITVSGEGLPSDTQDLIITGIDPCKAAGTVLGCRESGSTLRFLIPVAALSGHEMIMTGAGRLMDRPLTVYEDLFRRQGLMLRKEIADERVIRVQGPLQSGEFTMDGSVSSQFVTGMLLALPLLGGDSVIQLTPPVESRPYIDMTLDALRKFGAEICLEGWQMSQENRPLDSLDSSGASLGIPGGQRYVPQDVTVEGDWSNAAYLMAAGACVTGLDPESLQGDRVCTEYFRMLDEGCSELDITDCPDLGPALMAYAAMRHGCVLTGTRRLRIKESDRGAAMQAELAKFGVCVDIGENSIRVGCGIKSPAEVLDGHNDHRIVMALAALCLKTGGTIEGAEAVSKSFPDFFSRMQELGMRAQCASGDDPY